MPNNHRSLESLRKVPPGVKGARSSVWEGNVWDHRSSLIPRSQLYFYKKNIFLKSIQGLENIQNTISSNFSALTYHLNIFLASKISSKTLCFLWFLQCRLDQLLTSYNFSTVAILKIGCFLVEIGFFRVIGMFFIEAPAGRVLSHSNIFSLRFQACRSTRFQFQAVNL